MQPGGRRPGSEWFPPNCKQETAPKASVNMGAMDARPVSAGFEGEAFGVTGRGLASPLAGPAPSTGGRSSRPDSGRWLSEVMKALPDVISYK